MGMPCRASCRVFIPMALSAPIPFAFFVQIRVKRTLFALRASYFSSSSTWLKLSTGGCCRRGYLAILSLYTLSDISTNGNGDTMSRMSSKGTYRERALFAIVCVERNIEGIFSCWSLFRIFSHIPARYPRKIAVSEKSCTHEAAQGTPRKVQYVGYIMDKELVEILRVAAQEGSVWG